MRYSHGVDRLDLDVMRSAYWPDATDDHGVFVGNAWEFCDMVVRTHGRYLSTMHCVMNHLIELQPGQSEAHGEVYNVTYLHRLDGEQAVLDTWWGRYLDRYEQRDGEWRIAHRTCVHEWTTSTPIAQRMAIPSDRFRQGSEDRG